MGSFLFCDPQHTFISKIIYISHFELYSVYTYELIFSIKNIIKGNSILCVSALIMES